MRYILTPEQMKLCDQVATKASDSHTFLEKAASASIQVLLSSKHFKITSTTKFLIFCGSGNNGGDGFAMANLLKKRHYYTAVYYCGTWKDNKPDTLFMTEGCQYEYKAYTYNGGNVFSKFPEDLNHAADVIIIDAMIGIGLHSNPEGTVRTWIHAINQAKKPVLAIDIPSGLDALEGICRGEAICATVTTTMAFLKIGMLTNTAKKYYGEIHICDIGITSDCIEKDGFSFPCLIENKDLKILTNRAIDGHKGTFGSVLVIGGASGMCGAVTFAAKSAYRSGVGLARILTDIDNRIPVQILLPEAPLFSLDFSSNEDDKWESVLQNAISVSDVIAVGCGLGQSEKASQIISFVLSSSTQPLVMDADALNLLAKHQDWIEAIQKRNSPTILTPHMGEAARLLNLPVSEIINEKRERIAHKICEQYHVICVLKDAQTITSDGIHDYYDLYGNHGMATGGSGDCLTGIIASVIAQLRTDESLSLTHLAALGVCLHALAGDEATKNKGANAVMASDISEAIGLVLQNI